MYRILRRKYSSLNSPDFEPHSVIKVFKKSDGYASEPTTVKKRDVSVKTASKNEISEKPTQIATTNRNEMGIQMIPRNIFDQIFKQKKNDQIDPVKVER